MIAKSGNARGVTTLTITVQIAVLVVFAALFFGALKRIAGRASHHRSDAPSAQTGLMGDCDQAELTVLPDQIRVAKTRMGIELVLLDYVVYRYFLISWHLPTSNPQ